MVAVECLVFTEIPASTSSGNILFGLSFASIAYLAGYTGAGIVLFAIGIHKIRRR